MPVSNIDFIAMTRAAAETKAMKFPRIAFKYVLTTDSTESAEMLPTPRTRREIDATKNFTWSLLETFKNPTTNPRMNRTRRIIAAYPVIKLASTAIIKPIINAHLPISSILPPFIYVKMFSINIKMNKQ